MSKLHDLKDLRGGVIYAAAQVAPTTARTWALQLGQPREGGHPRYNAEDAVALVIMRQLTQEAMIAAAFASLIVNQLRCELPSLINRIVEGQESSGCWIWKGGPFAIVHARPIVLQGTPLGAWISIVEEHEIGAILAERQSGMSPIVLPLRRLINRALTGLLQVLHGEPPASLEV